MEGFFVILKLVVILETSNIPREEGGFTGRMKRGNRKDDEQSDLLLRVRRQ